MRSEQLEYLVDLKDTLSLSKTAEHFITSHQVISNAVKNLEQELGVTLLDRTHRGIIFTEAGLLVCQYAQETLANRHKLTNSLLPYVRPTLPKEKGELHIYTIPRFMNKAFLTFYNKYCKQHPKLTISLKNAALSFILDKVAITENAIILVSIDQTSLTSPWLTAKLEERQLSCQTLLAQPLGFCVSAKSEWLPQLAAQDIANLDMDSLQIPIVTFNYSVDESLFFHNTSAAYYLIDNFEMQHQLIKSGNYVGFYIPFEFNHLFKSDPTLEFVFDPASKHFFHYIAITADQTAPQVQRFLSELQAFYQAAPI